ncbi:MAG: NAD(+) diphosphatase [Desulfobulbaceae bacterium]|jgi:NAD+ diphosphatase|nr:NAD(+) diphosphatase [Desulfobulbaceae bacterium]
MTAQTDHRHFFIQGRRLLFIQDGNSGLRLYDGREAVGILYQRNLGNLGSGSGTAYLVADDMTMPPDCLALSLRAAYAHLDESNWVQAGRALQILDWHEQNRFCGRCGEKAVEQTNEFAMLCPRCGLKNYPRLAPAVIMAVTSGDEILLGRAHHFPDGMYSALAGFVEPGETLENAVRREAREETGVAVGQVRYFASQPWPFPNSLMIGFVAEARSRDIRLDHTELSDARWFTAENPPRLPDKMSIARRLIDAFFAQTRSGA